MTRSDPMGRTNILRALPFRRIAVMLMLLALTGCGRSNWGHVTGVVTLDGEPVGPGTLVFEPADPDRRNAPSSLGYFNGQGSYTLVSAGGKKGAPVGNYVVLIMPGGPSSLAEETIESERAPTSIPARYNDYDAGLKASIVAGSQTIDFQLTK